MNTSVAFRNIKIKAGILLLSIVFSGILTSCAKDPDEPEDPDEPPVVINKGKFKWTSAGVTTSADSAFYFPKFSTMYAYKNGTATTFEINVSSFSVGSYSISASTGNALEFVNNGTTYNASAGSIHINSSANDMIAGNFTANFPNNTPATITGDFSEVPRK